MNTNENKKKKFRQSKEWKSFRNVITHKFNHIDPITQKPLRKGCSIHHLDLNVDNYEVLDEKKFIPLNSLSHKFLHWIYVYYRKDKDILNRIKDILDKMVEMNDV